MKWELPHDQVEDEHPDFTEDRANAGDGGYLEDDFFSVCSDNDSVEG